MKSKNIILLLLLTFVILASLPFLSEHLGLLSLIAFVPLLCLEVYAENLQYKKTYIWNYAAFVLWNALTTFWVCNATIGGGLFAIFANAFQMSIIFAAFRFSKKIFKNKTLSYILLASLWIAWEKYYLTTAQISWPWLVLGNSFARTTSLVQWYEYTGTLGGSLWVWACNLALFALIMAFASGKWYSINKKAKVASVLGSLTVFLFPMIISLSIYFSFPKTNDNGNSQKLEVVALQPNIDSYEKFVSNTQQEQNEILLQQITKVLDKRGGQNKIDTPLLLVAPETFTKDVIVNDFAASPNVKVFSDFLKNYPGINFLFGASTFEYIASSTKPSHTARYSHIYNTWYESHNSSIIVRGGGESKLSANDIYHKSKLVLAVEMTPYPALFTKIDDFFGGGLMGRCSGQKEIVPMECRFSKDTISIGSAICYESVYGEHCREYVKKGAKALTIITNDCWWGDTPGYKQHLHFARLRAIELRRDIARCANTGISAHINQRGDILKKSSWWSKCELDFDITLNSRQTFFVREGDIVGKLAVLVSVLLLMILFSFVLIDKINVSKYKG